MTKDQAQKIVERQHPLARVCVEIDRKGRIKDDLVIGVGLNTVIGRGKTVYRAWLDAVRYVRKETKR